MARPNFQLPPALNALRHQNAFLVPLSIINRRISTKKFKAIVKKQPRKRSKTDIQLKKF